MVARRAHNPKVVGSNPAPATKFKAPDFYQGLFLFRHKKSQDQNKPGYIIYPISYKTEHNLQAP